MILVQCLSHNGIIHLKIKISLKLLSLLILSVKQLTKLVVGSIHYLQFLL